MAPVNKKSRFSFGKKKKGGRPSKGGNRARSQSRGRSKSRPRTKSSGPPKNRLKKRTIKRWDAPAVRSQGGITRNQQGRKFAEALNITGYAKKTGAAPVLEGMKGDLHHINFPFPLALTVGTDGAPLGSTTSANGVSAMPLDPYQFGPEMVIALQQCMKYNIVGLEMTKQLTSGLDPTLSKGRLALAIVSDPAWPLYNTPDYKEVLTQEDSVSWSLNSSESGPGQTVLKYTNKDKKLLYTQTNTPFSSWSKANEADIRQTYQCALVAGVQGSYVPVSTAAALSVGFLVCKVTVATYGRSPSTSIVGDSKLVGRLLEGSVVQAFNGGVCKSPPSVVLTVEKPTRINMNTGMKQPLSYMHPRDLVPIGYRQWYYARVLRGLMAQVFGPDADYAQIFRDAAGSGEDDDDDSGSDSGNDSDDDKDSKSCSDNFKTNVEKIGAIMSGKIKSGAMPPQSSPAALAATAPKEVGLSTDSKDVKTKAPTTVDAQIMSDAQFAALLTRAENAGLLKDRKLRARSMSPAKKLMRRGQSFRGAKGRLGVDPPLPSIGTTIPGMQFSVMCAWDSVNGRYAQVGTAEMPGIPISVSVTQPLPVKMMVALRGTAGTLFKPLGGDQTTDDVATAALNALTYSRDGEGNLRNDYGVAAAGVFGQAGPGLHLKPAVGGFVDQLTANPDGDFKHSVIMASTGQAYTGSYYNGINMALGMSVANTAPTDPSGSVNYTPDVAVSLGGLTTTQGYAKGVALIGTSNVRQYLGWGATPSGNTPTTTCGPIRGLQASDGKSTQLCIAALDPLPAAVTGSEGKAFKQETDGKMMSSMYGSNGSNSLNIGGDGSLAKIAQIADIASGVVSVVNSTTTPVLCQLVDGSGGSVAITNGLIGAYLADTTTNTPVKVNLRVVSGATIGELATTVLPPEDAGPSVAVGIQNFEKMSKNGLITVVHTAKQFYAEMLAYSEDKKDVEMKMWLCKPTSVSVEQLRLWKVKMDLTSAFLQPQKVCVELFNHAITMVQGK